MKKTIKSILAVACFAGIILAGCEEPDGTCNLIWTLGWITMSVISALAYHKLEDAR